MLKTVLDCLSEANQRQKCTSEKFEAIKDAYFQVPIVPEHTKYLRLAYEGRAYELQVLPFGLSTAPRVSMRVVRTMDTFLKMQGVDMHQYLVDWFMKNQSVQVLERRDQTGWPN